MPLDPHWEIQLRSERPRWIIPLDPAKIRERRERLKLSQREAAARAGMPQPNWARLESGERDDPQLSTAEKIATALGCTLPTITRGGKEKP